VSTKVVFSYRTAFSVNNGSPTHTRKQPATFIFSIDISIRGCKMSLPPELRLLCFQLSATPTTDLARMLPNLQRYVLRCQKPLSTLSVSAPKADASAASVLVHKLKTQLSSLINGRNPEGRFAAAVLIKSVVEVGGWEVLRGAESWVRGLLSILGVSTNNTTKHPKGAWLTLCRNLTQT
jgi:hypothetical protein